MRQDRHCCSSAVKCCVHDRLPLLAEAIGSNFTRALDSARRRNLTGDEVDRHKCVVTTGDGGGGSGGIRPLAAAAAAGAADLLNVVTASSRTCIAA